LQWIGKIGFIAFKRLLTKLCRRSLRLPNRA
jgi:hypothetical protein